MTTRADPPNPACAELEDRFARLSNLGDATAVLMWDQATVMPPGGAEARADQLATLDSLYHGMLTDPALADALESAQERADALDDWQAANLRLMARRVTRATALSAELVEAKSKARSVCEMRWRTARAEDDFAAFAEPFAPLLALVRETALAHGEALELAPYDALIDAYEPGARSDEIDVLFDDLAGFLPGFLGLVLEQQATKPRPEPLEGHFPVEVQRTLVCRLMEQLGFDFDAGRLDISRHPFCGGVPDDVRITTRYDESDFTSALMGVLHETGHALYERGLPAAWRDQPVGEAPGMAAHESQSLLVEMQVCRSAAFMTFAAPLIAGAFAAVADTTGPAWSPENLLAHTVRVEPGPIRVDADEVTYPAHILLRYRMEKAMIAGDLAIADLPGAFADGMKDLLGVVPPDDRDGCLQDTHWPEGLFGYFPCYTLGALAAAQLFDGAVRAVTTIPAALETGDFEPLTGWLETNVHSQGSRLATPDLIERASGAPLGTERFKAHLAARYLP